MTKLTITISNTEHFTIVNGVAVRLWEGRMADGGRVFALLAGVGLPADAPEADQERVQAALAPDGEPVAIERIYDMLQDRGPGDLPN